MILPTIPRCPGMAAGAVSLRKSHDIVILSFSNIVKGRANEHATKELLSHANGTTLLV